MNYGLIRGIMGNYRIYSAHACGVASGSIQIPLVRNLGIGGLEFRGLGVSFTV